MQRLLNAERAIELMEREQLDGLVAQLPVNSYYLSNYWGLFNTTVGYDGSYFAVLPRDPAAPAGLILPALEMRRLETRREQQRGTWMTSIYPYTGPRDDEVMFSDGTPRGADYAGWMSAQTAEFTPLEQRWRAITQRYGDQMSSGAFWALTRALTAAGLEGGAIGTDDARTAQWLGECGLATRQVRYCPQLFNEIRMIKSPAEVEIMRQAALINERALLLAADTMQAGTTWAELENVYHMTMAQQGGRGVYLMCGVGELPAAGVRHNEPVFFDALGQYRHYHGDFGRCGVAGEPSREHRKRHACLLAGWEVAQEHLRPGSRYSEISRAVGAAVRQAGLRHFRDPVVHGVGLEHTDDPKPFGVQPQSKEDQVLQPDMVVNVDMPHTEIGWGSLHMEDTVRITTYGHERLTTADFSIRRASGNALI